jgi:hypothetical protein
MRTLPLAVQKRQAARRVVRPHASVEPQPPPVQLPLQTLVVLAVMLPAAGRRTTALPQCVLLLRQVLRAPRVGRRPAGRSMRRET